MANLSTEIHHLCPDSQGTSLVSVYIRQLAKGAVFYARYKIDKRSLANGQRFITESLKTDNLELAIQRAHQRFAEIRFSQEQNIGLKDITVEQAITRFLDNYQRNVDAGVTGFSRHMLTSFKVYFRNYWIDYIGSKQLSRVTVHDFEEYEAWRKKIAQSRIKLRAAEKATVARTTLKLEIGAFKQCLRWLKERQLYVGAAETFRFRVGERAKRSAFTIEQYEKLCRFMRRNDFLRRAKYSNDHRHERYRQMLRTYVLFMANTGLRVGEARNLKWGDVQERTNKLGQPVVVVRIAIIGSKMCRHFCHSADGIPDNLFAQIRESPGSNVIRHIR